MTGLTEHDVIRCQPFITIKTDKNLLATSDVLRKSAKSRDKMLSPDIYDGYQAFIDTKINYIFNNTFIYYNRMMTHG
jgi:hypothetical protein